MVETIISYFLTIMSLVAPVFVSNDFQSYNISHKPSIDEVKAIYLTGYTAGSKTRRQALRDVVNSTELNAMVIDVKDASGRVFFDTNIEHVDNIGSEDIRIPDLKDWLQELKADGIHTIARIVVFNDPYLASHTPEIALKHQSGGLWRDYKGQMWVDPTKKFVWDYNLDIARAAIDLGFDEINFDYVRFPSDGNIKTIVYDNVDNKEDKNRVMKEFYEYVNKNMSYYPVLTSADLFGMTLTRHDGLNIGQRLEDAAPNFDYIAPMTYPSHYPVGYDGLDNPADHPYRIIYGDLVKAQSAMAGQRAKLRPWLQDFDLGAVYGPDKIIAQKQAVYDGGGNGWFLWNASNNYTIAGLEKE